MKTKKQKLPAPASRIEMEELLGEIQELTIEAAEETTTLNSIIADAQAQFAPVIARLQEEIGARIGAAQLWAESHPEEFRDAKSIRFRAGTIGFRTGTPKLKTLRGQTWEKVLGHLRALKLFGFIRTKEEIDKDAILAERSALGEKDWEKLGLKIVQEEVFYVEPDLEKTATRHTREAA